MIPQVVASNYATQDGTMLRVLGYQVAPGWALVPLSETTDEHADAIAVPGVKAGRPFPADYRPDLRKHRSWSLTHVRAGLRAGQHFGHRGPVLRALAGLRAELATVNAAVVDGSTAVAGADANAAGCLIARTLRML